MSSSLVSPIKSKQVLRRTLVSQKSNSNSLNYLDSNQRSGRRVSSWVSQHMQVWDTAVLTNNLTERRRFLFRSPNHKDSYTALRKSPRMQSNPRRLPPRLSIRSLRVPDPSCLSQIWRIWYRSCLALRILKTSTKTLTKKSMLMVEPLLTSLKSSYRAFSYLSSVQVNPVLNWWLKRSEVVHQRRIPLWKSGLATTVRFRSEKGGSISHVWLKFDLNLPISALEPRIQYSFRITTKWATLGDGRWNLRLQRKNLVQKILS